MENNRTFEAGKRVKNQKAFPKACFFFLIISLFILTLSFTKTETRAAVIPAGSRANLIWFGDSRTVQLAHAVYHYKIPKSSRHPAINKKHVVAKSGTTISWARGSGYKKLRKRLKKRPTATVIINMGINDIIKGNHHADDYLKLIRKIHKKFPKASIYFMSVNPVRNIPGRRYGFVGMRAHEINKKSKAFNSYIKRHLPKKCGYINTWSKVRFTYKDCLHYNKYTYRRICKYVTGKRTLKK